MSDDAQRWKDKYLSSLEQQEKLERRWELRLDLLRRGLVRSRSRRNSQRRSSFSCCSRLLRYLSFQRCASSLIRLTREMAFSA